MHIYLNYKLVIFLYFIFALDHAVGGQVVQVLLGAALVLAELHDVAHIFVGHMDVHAHIGLVEGLILVESGRWAGLSISRVLPSVVSTR